MHELDVCALQAPLLPKNDPVHPLVSQRVKIIRDRFKGYFAVIKDVRSSGLTVEIDAQLAGTSPVQVIDWTDFVVVYELFLLSSFLPYF